MLSRIITASRDYKEHRSSPFYGQIGAFKRVPFALWVFIYSICMQYIYIFCFYAILPVAPNLYSYNINIQFGHPCERLSLNICIYIKLYVIVTRSKKNYYDNIISSMKEYIFFQIYCALFIFSAYNTHCLMTLKTRRCDILFWSSETFGSDKKKGSDRPRTYRHFLGVQADRHST